MLARRFLGCVFFLILLAVAGAFLYYQFGGAFLIKQATPQGHYQAPAAGDPGPDYTQAGNWLARPGDGSANLAGWLPSQADGSVAAPRVDRSHIAATFFVHPTTYLGRDRWNAALVPDATSEGRTAIFVRSQASVFNDVSEVWAPRYRQAAFGAFLLRNDDATKALDLAYRDVLAAFDAFLAANPGRPIILAGHSQGALHVSRLLADRKDALNGRLVAAYVIGWPLSATADLPAMGRAACTAPDETGCILSWQSFAEPANPALIMDSWVGTKGPGGMVRQRADMVCVNPLTGTKGGSAPASANLGTLRPSADFSTATVAAGQVGARCSDGLLLVDGELPPAGGFVLPGNNYHPFDYALFWGSIRADVARRVAAFK